MYAWLAAFAMIHFPFTTYAVIVPEPWDKDLGTQLITVAAMLLFFIGCAGLCKYRHVVLSNSPSMLNKCLYLFAHHSIWIYIVHMVTFVAYEQYYTATHPSDVTE